MGCGTAGTWDCTVAAVPHPTTSRDKHTATDVLPIARRDTEIAVTRIFTAFPVSIYPVPPVRTDPMAQVQNPCRA